MKQLMVIIDGMADLPCAILGNKTPLEAAHTPNLDRLVALGELLTTPEGMLTDSQTCILSILGVPQGQLPRGRAFLEALACDMPFAVNDLLLRINFVGVRKGELVHNFLPCPGELPELSPWPVYPMGQTRAIVRLPGAADMADKLKTFPPHQHMGKSFAAVLPVGCELADRLAQAAQAMLKRTGATSFVPWSPSVHPRLPTFEALHGMRGAVVTGTAVVTGIGRGLGMTCPPIPGATGDTDTALDAKLCRVWQLLPDHDFVLLHLNGTDEAAHRRDPSEKADFIAAVDRDILGPILGGLDRDTELVVLSDHATLAETGAHAPLPVAVWGHTEEGTPPNLPAWFPGSVRIHTTG